MLWTFALLTSSFLLSLVFTPILRELALRKGWVDKPDNKRKLHKTPIPRIGGVPIVLAYGGALTALLLIDLIRGVPAYQHLSVAWSFLLPGSFIFLIGLLDDLVGLQPWGKIGLETVVALLAYYGGIQIHSFVGHPIPNYVGCPLTILWLLGCTNAFNLIDGLDGLSCGVGLIATVATLAVGVVHGDLGLVTATAPLAGALLGFLIFNFNPASIFLGDSGSLWIGFMLACSGVVWSQKSLAAISVVAPLIALFVPLLETGLSIVRRFLRCEPIFHADRGHMHHQLLDRGLTPRRAVLLLYAFATLGAIVSMMQSMASDVIRGVILLVIFGAAAWGAIWYLRYQEFTVTADLFRRNGVRSMVKTHFLLARYEGLLLDAKSPEECWGTIRSMAAEFGVIDVELRLAGWKFKEKINRSAMGKWVVQVPLSQSEYVKLYCQYGTSAGNNAAVAKMADLLLRCLASKTEMSLDLSSEAVEISELRTEPQAVKAPLTAKA